MEIVAALRKHTAAVFRVDANCGWTPEQTIANAPERLGKRQSRAEVEQLMRDTKLDGQMKLLGLWSDWESGKRGREK